MKALPTAWSLLSQFDSRPDRHCRPVVLYLLGLACANAAWVVKFLQAGAAIVVFDKSGEWDRDAYFIGPKEVYTIFDCEVLTLRLAILMAGKYHRLKRLAIYCDSQGA